MLLNTPTIALEQCKHVIASMADAIYENYQLATSLIYDYDASKRTQLEENESFIDKCESVLSAYIVKINSKRLSKDDRLVASEILNSISDFERMGDHCINIAYVAQDKNEQRIHFSPTGHKEVETIIAAVDATMKTTFDAFKNNDAGAAIRVEPLAETIDKLKETIKAHHVERLQNGDCGIEGGIALVDLVTSFERLASHCANISLHIIKRVENDSNFDEMHGHANDNFSEEYKALYYYYESQYLAPVLVDNMAAATENAAVQPKAEEKKISDKHEHIKEHSKKKTEKKDIIKKELIKKDTEKKDTDRKEVLKKESEKKESDKKEISKKDSVKKAPAKKTADKKLSDKKTDSKKNEKKK
jgi:phosphate:Na+ symporter